MIDINQIGDTRRKAKFDPGLADIVNRRYEAKPVKKTRHETVAPMSTSSIDFFIEAFDNYYRIGGVQCHDGPCAIDLSTELLPERTLLQHANHAKKAKPDEFRACGAPLVYAVCKVLCENKANAKYARIVEEAKNFLQKAFKENWLNTLSRVQYNSQGLDKVIYESKQVSKEEKLAKLVGRDGCITKPKTDAQEYCQAILGTKDDVAKINEVFKWVTGKESYAWRINSAPSSIAERVLVLGVNDDGRFGIDTDGVIVGRPALGVRRAKNFSTRNGGAQ